jgi:hypothetical protein
MSRKVNSVVVEGAGIRVTWSDDTIDQYIWTQAGQNFALRNAKTGGQPSQALVSEIIDNLTTCINSQSLYSHLFGVSGDHLNAAAVTQIGNSLTQNAWTRVIYDDAGIESHSNAVSINDTTGVITFLGGEWLISGHVQIHKTSSAAINLMIQLWNENDSQEVARTFRTRSTSAKINAPASMRLQTLYDANGGGNISIRVRVDSTDAVFGTLPGDIPTGSSNSAGLLTILRTG